MRKAICLSVVCLALSGCYIGEAFRAFLRVPPGGGQSDAKRLGGAIPGAAAGNIYSWIEIGSIVASFIVGAVGGVKVQKRRERRRRDCASTIESLPLKGSR